MSPWGSYRYAPSPTFFLSFVAFSKGASPRPQWKLVPPLPTLPAKTVTDLPRSETFCWPRFVMRTHSPLTFFASLLAASHLTFTRSGLDWEGPTPQARSFQIRFPLLWAFWAILL